MAFGEQLACPIDIAIGECFGKVTDSVDFGNDMAGAPEHSILHLGARRIQCFGICLAQHGNTEGGGSGFTVRPALWVFAVGQLVFHLAVDDHDGQIAG